MKLKFNSDDDLPLNKPLKLHAMAILSDLFLKKVVNFIHKFFRRMLIRIIKTEINIRQTKITNCSDYLFNDNKIVNVKDFDSSLLEINKLSFKGAFSLNIYNIYYIKDIPAKYPNCVSIDLIELIMMKIFFICFLMM